MNGQTDWLSAIGILLAGLVMGFMFVYAYVMRRRSAQPEDLVLRDLEAKRDALLQQLRELGPDDRDERARLEIEAATVLRKIDQHGAGVAAADSAVVDRRVAGPHTEAAFFAKHPELKGFMWGVGSIGVIVFLWYFGFQHAKPKEEGAPAPMQQPAVAQQQMPAQSHDDPAIKQLEARIAQSPDDLSARLELTHAYLDKENMMGVFAQTEYILKKDPKNAEAATYQALVRMAMGQGDQALLLLKSATKNDPSLIDGWVSLAWYYVQTNNTAEAKKAIAEAVKRHPEQKAKIEAVFAQMESQKTAPGAPAAQSPAESSGGAIVVTVNLGVGKAVPEGGVLYVLARGEGVTAGPPVAVKRIAATTFPITVDLSGADSMMGQQMPAKVRLEARLDADGNVMTKGPNDLNAVQDGVALGSQVALTLK
jgi:cytochrome c-type biogenesis protein CcmH